MRPIAARLRDLRYRLFYGVLLRKGYDLEVLGNPETGCHWYFCPSGLDERSVVYTAGIGRDVTFEHALVERFGCTITMLDPSPTGLETMRLAENQIPQFKFEPLALSSKAGTLRLAPPTISKEGSWYMREGEGDTIQVPCVDLATLMKKNGDKHIDLLKIDIEGAEYEVLDQLLAERLPVKQVLVEFHHGLVPGVRRSRTVYSILKMALAGYRLLKQDGLNHTFTRERE